MTSRAPVAIQASAQTHAHVVVWHAVSRAHSMLCSNCMCFNCTYVWLSLLVLPPQGTCSKQQPTGAPVLPKMLDPIAVLKLPNPVLSLLQGLISWPDNQLSMK